MRKTVRSNNGSTEHLSVSNFLPDSTLVLTLFLCSVVGLFVFIVKTLEKQVNAGPKLIFW